MELMHSRSRGYPEIVRAQLAIPAELSLLCELRPDGLSEPQPRNSILSRDKRPEGVRASP
jgi:hypothetical protein